MKALVGAFNQEKALVGAFSVIVQPVVEPMDHFTALFRDVENILVEEEDVGGKKSLRKALVATEQHILDASKDLKEIIVESGSMAESLFERVDMGYKELEEEIKGLSNVEQVLLDTADSVMDTKRKIEFGVQQIIFKVR